MGTRRHPLTRYRDINKLTITALAHQLGVSKAAVSRWEGGRLPEKAKWSVIEAKTGVRVEDLARFTAETPA
jgi:transcriptional regulator with XRE-family HTH domain